MKNSNLPGSAKVFDRLLKGKCFRRLEFLGAMALATGLGIASVLGANVKKANNTTDLDVGSSWVGGVVPGASDTAVWDSTVTGANSTLLGTNLSWMGLQISSPGGAVTIGATSTNANDGATLTLGSGGIDMSGTGQNVTLNAPVTLLGDSVQSWNINSGATLSLVGTFTRSAGSQLRCNIFSGTVNIASGTVNAPLDYVLYNGTDVGALDSGGNVSAVATAIGYTANTAGGGSDIYLDVVNGVTNGDDVALTGTTYPAVVRFNTPQPYRNYWIYNVGGRANETADPGSTYLMTTNVGAQDVYINGGGNTFRFNHTGNELIFDQEDPDGTFYVNGSDISQRGGAGVITKFGVGRVVWNSGFGNFSGPINIIAGQMLINTTPNSSSALMVGGDGTLAGTGTIPGAVTVNGGTIQPGGEDGSGTLNLADLTLNDGSSLVFRSLNALLNLTGNLTNGTVNVSILAAVPAVGQYSLVKWTNGIPANLFADFNLATLPLRTLGYLSNNTANSSIDLVVTNLLEPIKWTAANGTWDINTTANWADNVAASTTYQEANGLGDSVLLDDTASGTSPIAITLGSTVVPASVTVNASKDYSITGAGDIAGLAALTKSGSGTLTLGTMNTFAGGLNLNGGIVNFSSPGNLGSGAINFGGGTLQYAPANTADISSFTLTFNAGGGTIDDGGNAVTFANPIGNGGAGGFTKAGSGTLTLNGNSDYSGNTVVAQGTLALGANASLASSAAIVVDSGATLDTATSGVGLTLNGAVNQVLGGTGTVTGEVTNAMYTTISPADNGTYGTLSLGGDLSVEGGTLAMDISSSSKDMIVVSSNLDLQGGTLQLNVSGTLPNGTYKLIQYGGTLVSGAGSSSALLLVGFNQPGQSGYLIDSTSGEIDLEVSTAASDNLTWSGSSGATWDLSGSLNWLNGAAGWSFTNGDFVTFDNSGASSVSINDSVRPGSVTVDASQNYTFAGTGKISGSTGITKSGTGTLIMETPNDYTGPTTINAGTVQIGNGGSGDIGFGNVTNNGALVFAQGDGAVHNVAGSVNGTGSLTVNGTTTVALQKDNSYSGPTTVSAGTLQLGNGVSTTGTMGTGNVTDNDTLILNHGSGSYSLPNDVTGSGTLMKIGGGNVTLGGGLTYQGNTFISNGVVTLSANGQLPNAVNTPGSTGWLILDGGNTAGTLDLAGHSATINALSGNAGTVNGLINSSTGTGLLTILGSAATTYSGNLADNGGQLQLALLGTNVLTLGVANSYSGGTVLGAGAAVTLNSSGALGTGNITMSNNASITLGGGNGQYLTTPVTTAPGATAVFTVGSNYAYNGGYSNPFGGDSTTTNVFVSQVTWHTAGQFDNFFGTVRLVGDPSLNGVRVFAATDGSTNTSLDMQGGNFFVRNGGDVITFGALTGSGFGVINGGGTYIIGAKGTDTTYGGTLGGSLSFVKDGAGTLTLFGTNESLGIDSLGNDVTNFTLLNETTFTGTLTVSNGVLVVQAPNNLNDITDGNPASFVLAGDSAVLDISSMGSSPDGTTLVTNSTLSLGVNSASTAQSLSGFGTIQGSVVAASGSTVAPGGPVGTLNVSGSVEIGGALTMNVDATNSPNSSELMSPTITIDSGATLVVANIGPEAGAKFQLFNQAINTNNFASITLPPLTGTNHWINDLGSDGSITLVAPRYVPTNAVPIAVTVANGNLTLQWPASHTGWRLQSQTNSLGVGLSTNWADFSGGATGTNAVTVPLSSANEAVFFRLVYP